MQSISNEREAEEYLRYKVGNEIFDAGKRYWYEKADEKEGPHHFGLKISGSQMLNNLDEQIDNKPPALEEFCEGVAAIYWMLPAGCLVGVFHGGGKVLERKMESYKEKYPYSYEIFNKKVDGVRVTPEECLEFVHPVADGINNMLASKIRRALGGEVSIEQIFHVPAERMGTKTTRDGRRVDMLRTGKFTDYHALELRKTVKDPNKIYIISFLGCDNHLHFNVNADDIFAKSMTEALYALCIVDTPVLEDEKIIIETLYVDQTGKCYVFKNGLYQPVPEGVIEGGMYNKVVTLCELLHSQNSPPYVDISRYPDMLYMCMTPGENKFSGATRVRKYAPE